MGHMILHPLQAPAAGAGARGPGPECGTSAAALPDLPAQSREGPDHCGFCPRGHLSGQPSPGPAGGGGEQSSGRMGEDRTVREVFAPLSFSFLYLWDKKGLGFPVFFFFR
jgi:hypothetical protein